VWWFIQDFLKVLAYWFIRKYNLFNYNDTGRLVLPESTVRYIEQHKLSDMKKAVSTGAGH